MSYVCTIYVRTYIVLYNAYLCYGEWVNHGKEVVCKALQITFDQLYNILAIKESALQQSSYQKLLTNNQLHFP